MNTLYFIGSYRNNMHYTDGIDVWEIVDYTAGFTPTFTKKPTQTWEDALSWMDSISKLTNEQKLRYDPDYHNIPKLLSIYNLSTL